MRKPHVRTKTNGLYVLGRVMVPTGQPARPTLGAGAPGGRREQRSGHPKPGVARDAGKVVDIWGGRRGEPCRFLGGCCAHGVACFRVPSFGAEARPWQNAGDLSSLGRVRGNSYLTPRKRCLLSALTDGRLFASLQTGDSRSSYPDPQEDAEL